MAVVNGHVISESDLDRSIQGELSGLEERLSQLKSAALDFIVSETLIAQEATRLNVTPNELISSQLSDVLISDLEVDSAYEANRNQAGLLPELEAKEQIRASLLSRKRQEVYAKLIERLKKGAKIEVFLPASRVVTVPIDVQKDPIRGAENPIVTIVEFSDFECPFCKKATDPLKAILADYPTQVRLVYKNFPLPTHPRAFLASQAALCAHDQGRFWDFHDALFSGMPAFEKEKLKQIAGTLHLNEIEFSSCLDSGRHIGTLKESIQAGKDAAVSGTPTFFVNGRLIRGALGYDDWKSIIDGNITGVGGNK